MPETREVFPVTFFNGQGPVIVGGADFRPSVQMTDADNPPETQEENPSGLEDEDSEQQETTALEIAGKPKAAAPD